MIKSLPELNRSERLYKPGHVRTGADGNLEFVGRGYSCKSRAIRIETKVKWRMPWQHIRV
jgi:hypothetical protein